jgi:FkbM family methyltransferase
MSELVALSAERLRYLGALAKLRALYTVGRKHTTHRLLTGELLRLRTNDILAKRVVRERRFETEVRRCIEDHVRPGMTVLDVGANVGYYTVKMATLVGASGRVLAFEPNPSVLAELQFNVELNRLRNVQVFPLALAEQSGKSTFCVPRPGWESHGSLRPNDSFQVSSTAEVQTDRLDTVLSSLGSPKIDFVKMDVEGAEMGVIRGAAQFLSRPDAPPVVFEAVESHFSAFGHSVFDVLHAFESHGYRVKDLGYHQWLATKPPAPESVRPNTGPSEGASTPAADVAPHR